MHMEALYWSVIMESCFSSQSELLLTGIYHV
jgi:hypothetical protein